MLILDNAAPIIKRCSFNYCRASGQGGALRVEKSEQYIVKTGDSTVQEPSLENVNFYGNTATNGGGVIV